jgi:hypothetical protein
LDKRSKEKETQTGEGMGLVWDRSKMHTGFQAENLKERALLKTKVQTG